MRIITHKHKSQKSIPLNCNILDEIERGLSHLVIFSYSFPNMFYYIYFMKLS